MKPKDISISRTRIDYLLNGRVPVALSGLSDAKFKKSLKAKSDAAPTPR